MNTDIVKIRDQVTAMSDMDSIAAAWLVVLNAKSLIKRIEEVMKDRAKNIMLEQKIKEVKLNDTIKIILAKKKKDRFDTEAIFKLLGFTKEQIDVLPKNPKWKKTAILANEKTSPAHWIDEFDEVEAKDIDEKYQK